MVCIGQPMLIAGDLNADPAVIPVLLRVFLLVGMLIWTLLILWVLVFFLMLLVVFNRGGGHWFLVEISLSVVPMLLLHLMLVMSLVGGLLLTFLYLRAFALMPGWLTLLALLYVSLFGLLVGWTLLIGPPHRSTRVVQDVWDVYRDGS